MSKQTVVDLHKVCHLPKFQLQILQLLDQDLLKYVLVELLEEVFDHLFLVVRGVNEQVALPDNNVSVLSVILLFAYLLQILPLPVPFLGSQI